MDNEIKEALDQITEELDDLGKQISKVESNLSLSDTKVWLLRLDYDFHEESVFRRLNSIDTTIKILKDHQRTDERRIGKLDNGLQYITMDIDNSRRDAITQKDALSNLEEHLNRKIKKTGQEAQDLLEQKLNSF